MVFVVLREQNSVKGPAQSEEIPDYLRPSVDINALGFAGTIAVKNQ